MNVSPYEIYRFWCLIGSVKIPVYPLKYWIFITIILVKTNFVVTTSFLGGLSLHLNHLIAWRTGISFWQFGTLPIGIFLSNLDSRHLITSPRTLLGQFWHMSIFGDSRANWVIYQKKMPSENQFFSQWRSDGVSKCLGVCRWAGT